MKRLTRKQIEAMPYGSPEQMKAADVWMQHLMNLWLRTVEGAYHHGGFAVPCDWWYTAIETAIRKVVLNDVWYQARRRWNAVVRDQLEKTA